MCWSYKGARWWAAVREWGRELMASHVSTTYNGMKIPILLDQKHCWTLKWGMASGYKCSTELIKVSFKIFVITNFLFTEELSMYVESIENRDAYRNPSTKPLWIIIWCNVFFHLYVFSKKTYMVLSHLVHIVDMLYICHLIFYKCKMFDKCFFNIYE